MDVQTGHFPDDKDGSRQGKGWCAMKNLTCISIGLVVGFLLTLICVNSSAFFPPKPPHLETPDSIAVLLHPWGGYEAAATKRVEIPSERIGDIFRRLTPDKFNGGPHDKLNPIVADAYLQYGNAKVVHVVVREAGHNPAIVSVDGDHYFYAINAPGIHAGANELIRIIGSIACDQP